MTRTPPTLTIRDWLGDLFANTMLLMFVLFAYTITGIS